MDSRESYEFVKRLCDSGIGIMETRCWMEAPGPDNDLIAFGCGSYFRFIIGNPIFCPFCGCQHPYTQPLPGSSYWAVYPITPRFTGEWGTLTDEERTKRERGLAMVKQRQAEMAGKPQWPN